MEYALIYISSFHKLIFVIVNNCLGVGSKLYNNKNKKKRQKVLNALLHVMDSFNELENYFFFYDYTLKTFRSSVPLITFEKHSLVPVWQYTAHSVVYSLLGCVHDMYPVPIMKYFFCLSFFSPHFLSFRLYIFNYFTKCYGKLNFSRAQLNRGTVRGWAANSWKFVDF